MYDESLRYLEAVVQSRIETLAQVFSCEFCEISKNTFFYRTPPVAASDITKIWKPIAVCVKICLCENLLTTLIILEVSENKMLEHLKNLRKTSGRKKLADQNIDLTKAKKISLYSMLLKSAPLLSCSWTE